MPAPHASLSVAADLDEKNHLFKRQLASAWEFANPGAGYIDPGSFNCANAITVVFVVLLANQGIEAITAQGIAESQRLLQYKRNAS